MTEQPQLPLEGDRDGATYEAAWDRDRLNAQHVRVWTVMRDGTWWTLAQVARQTGDPEASISARIRDFRKARFGGHQVVRRRTPSGRFQYALRWRQVLVPTAKQIVDAWEGVSQVPHTVAQSRRILGYLGGTESPPTEGGHDDAHK